MTEQREDLTEEQRARAAALFEASHSLPVGSTFFDYQVAAQWILSGGVVLQPSFEDTVDSAYRDAATAALQRTWDSAGATDVVHSFGNGGSPLCGGNGSGTGDRYKVTCTPCRAALRAQDDGPIYEDPEELEGKKQAVRAVLDAVMIEVERMNPRGTVVARAEVLRALREAAPEG